MLIRILVVMFAVLGSNIACAQTAPSTRRVLAPRPLEAIDHVLIISIDGLRPDLALRADAPTLRAAIDAGAASFWAQTVPHAITLPSHVSMLTGVHPRKHEIEWNSDLPLSKPVYPKVATIFELAKKRGYTTALIAGKSKFDIVNKPGTIDHVWITSNVKDEDEQVAAQAAKIILEHKPDLAFVHLPTTDNVGHAKGWGSKEQLAAIKGADAGLKVILDAVEKAGLRDRTLVIITADHGGAGLTHRAGDLKALHIPWIAFGPSVRKGHDLNLDPKLDVYTYDTAATALWLLGVTLPEWMEGKPLKQAFVRDELIEDRADVTVEEIGLRDPWMWQLLDERKKLTRKLEDKQREFGNDHKEVTAAKIALDRINQDIEEHGRLYRSMKRKGSETRPAPK